MSAALDSLADVAEVETAKWSPTREARDVDSAPAAVVLAKREVRWAGIIPDGLPDSVHNNLENALDIAHYVLNISVKDLAKRYVAIATAIADEKGIEQDDQKVARSTAIRLSKELVGEALAINPFADVPKKIEMQYNRYQAYARSLGWSPAQIASCVVASVVACEGDKDKAAAVFAKRVTSEMDEPGFKGALNFNVLVANTMAKEQAGGAGLQLDSDSVLAKFEDKIMPEHKPYADGASVAVMGVGRDAAGNGIIDHAVLTKDLHADIADREQAALVADSHVAVMDRVAAEKLSGMNYAVYRVMRKEAHLIGNTENGTTLTQSIKEQLHFGSTQGVENAVKVVKDALRKEGLKDIEELSAKAARRMDMTDAEIASAVITKKAKKVEI